MPEQRNIENEIHLNEFMEIKTKLVKRVWFEDPSNYDIITDWILRSHEQRMVPSIIVTGPICSGKTELAKTVTCLARNGWICSMLSVQSLTMAMNEDIIAVLDDPEISGDPQRLYDLMEDGRIMLTSKNVPPVDNLQDFIHIEMRQAPEDWIQEVKE